jgi:hypothetical protein
VGQRAAEPAQRPVERQHQARERPVDQRQHDPVATPGQPGAPQPRPAAGDERPVGEVPLHPQARLRQPRPRPPTVPLPPGPLRPRDRPPRRPLRAWQPIASSRSCALSARIHPRERSTHSAILSANGSTHGRARRRDGNPPPARWRSST